MIALFAILLLSGQAAAPAQTTDVEPPASAPPAQPALPPATTAAEYDASIRTAAEAALGEQGRLEGGWSLTREGGGEIYRFELREPEAGRVEGAWRDMTVTPSRGSSGLLDQAAWDGVTLKLGFTEGDAADVLAVSLTPKGGDHWTGEIRRGGQVTQVAMSRR